MTTNASTDFRWLLRREVASWLRRNYPCGPRAWPLGYLIALWGITTQSGDARAGGPAGGMLASLLAPGDLTKNYSAPARWQ